MSMFWRTLAVIALGTLTAACYQTSNGGYSRPVVTNQAVGTVAGGVAGGYLGHHIFKGSTAGTIGGAIVGAMLGGAVGSRMDEVDRSRAYDAQQRAYGAPMGSNVNWRNPRTGNYGYVTPTRDGYDQSGAHCREYQHTVTIGGRQEQAYGTACRQPDGSWQIVQ